MERPSPNSKHIVGYIGQILAPLAREHKMTVTIIRRRSVGIELRRQWCLVPILYATLQYSLALHNHSTSQYMGGKFVLASFNWSLSLD